MNPQKLKPAKRTTVPPDSCPPILAQLVAQEGNLTAAAKHIKAGNYTIMQIANGAIPMSPKMQAKIEAGLKEPHGPPASSIRVGHPPPEEAPPKPEIIVPPWDKKMGTVKITKQDGSKQTFKVPALIALLFERHDNIKNEVGKALGYSGWNPVNDIITKGNYEKRVHARAYAAVNGLEIPGVKKRNGDDEPDNDTYSLGLAICMVTLSEYERLEEFAEVMGGKRVFRMTAGATGWIVIFRIAARDKLETFKRLARRDAKKIVCP